MITEYATVHGRFYRGTTPIDGAAYFRPRQKTIAVFGALHSLSPIEFSIIDGVLVDIDSNPGVSIPASYFGLIWDLYVLPLEYSNVLHLFPGDIISIGD